MDDRPIRALLVDDDEDDFVVTRDMLAESTRGSAVKLDWVSTYEEGLDVICRAEHDVYLIDYRLGGRSGLDLLRAAMEEGCRAPVIVLTGQGDHDIDVMAMEAGATDYLVKGQVDAALLERSLRYAIERNQLDQLRDALVDFASQELRAPIMSVKDRARGILLEDTAALADGTVDDLGSIIQAADHLTRQIDGFLDIAKIDSGRQIDLAIDAFDVGGLVDEALEIQSASGGRCAYGPTLDRAPTTLRADRYKLLLALVGLLSGAESRSPDGGTVRVSVSPTADGTSFAISDGGDAISEEAMTQLLERRRVGAHDSDSGLDLARHLVEAHGGVIAAEAGPDHGTTVTFTIPNC